MWRFAGLLVAVAACGDGAVFPDAAGPPDSSQPTGLVHLRVVGLEQPQVFFQAADSRVLLATTTDANNEASAFVEPNSFVTAYGQDGGGGRTMWTYAGVQPGDDLLIDLTTPALTDPQDFVPGDLFRLNATLDFTFAQPPPEATRYLLRTVCGSFLIDSAFRAYAGDCPPSSDLLVVAMQDGGTPEDGGQFSIALGYQFEAAHDMANPVVSFPGPFRGFDVSPVSITNAPVVAQTLSIGQRLVEDRKVLWRVPPSEVSISEDGTSRVDLFIPRPSTPTMYTSIDPRDDSDAHIIDWRPASEEVSLDWPTLRATTVAPIYDATATQIRWEESPDGEPGNFARAMISWSTVNDFTTWTIASARSEDPVVRVPLLPRADLHPRNESLEVQSLRVSDEMVGQLRQRMLGAWRPASPSPLDAGRDWPIEGPRGTVVWRAAQVPFRF